MPGHSTGEPPSEGFGYDALARYFAGECDEREEIAIGRWIAADPDRVAEVERLRAVWDASVGEQPDVDAAFRKVMRRRVARGLELASGAAGGAGAGRRERARRVSGSGRRPVVWRLVGLAAAVGVIAVGSLTAWRTKWFASAQQFREFASAPGSRTTITLRDGTQLVLGPATHLRVPSDFGTSVRAVDLDGEALFMVVHDARHPFEVRTGRATVRDVGTTFAVRAYRDDAESKVAVAEGEVALGTASLRARDVATIDAGGAISVRRGVDVSTYLAWTQGRLAFADTPLRDVARELSRTFGLDVQIADSAMAGQRITVTFGDESVGDVLAAVSYLVGGHYERAGRVVVIRRGSVPTGRSTPAGQVVPSVAQGAKNR
jgi:ferric-dicitrate binding protein FerR (iron transport regulator)